MVAIPFNYNPKQITKAAFDKMMEYMFYGYKLPKKELTVLQKLNSK